MPPVPRGAQIQAPGNVNQRPTPTGNVNQRSQNLSFGQVSQGSPQAQSGALRSFGQSQFRISVGDAPEDGLSSLAERNRAVIEERNSVLTDFLERAQEERKKANKQVRKERQEVLGQLDELEASVGADINTVLANSAAQENAANVEAVRNFQEQFASLGRPVSPTAVGQISRRLAAGSAGRISSQSAELRASARNERFNIIQARNQIFQATIRETPSDLEILQAAQAFGAARGSGSGSFTAGGGRNQAQRQRDAGRLPITSPGFKPDERGKKRNLESQFNQLTPAERIAEFGTSDFAKSGLEELGPEFKAFEEGQGKGSSVGGFRQPVIRN